MSYDPSWNRSHLPTADESWQESDAYWFYDATAGIGGWHRVGQHPGSGTGQDCHFLFVEGGARALSLSPDSGAVLSRTDEGQAIGTSYAKHVDGDIMDFGWSDADSAADVQFYENFYTPRNWKAAVEDADYSDKVNEDGGHLEVAGRLRGTVRIGDTEHEIDALAHRDRSWGRRDLHAFSALWFSNGTVGPELSWASMMVRMTNGAVMKMGFIDRDGVSEDIIDLMTSVSLSDDGLSSTGADFKLITKTEELLVRMRPKQGFMQTFPPSMIVTDHCSSVELEGKQGFCDLAVVSNPFRGSFMPTASDVSAICVDEGLSSAADCSQLLLTDYPPLERHMDDQSEQDVASKSSIDAIIGESRGARNEITAESLTAFLKSQNGIGDDVSVSGVRPVGENAGASSGSLIFEGAFGSDEEARYLVKYDPQSPMAPFHQYEMGAQFHVQRALHRSGVLTPKPLWFDADGSMLETPGYIMEFIEAESPAASAYTNGLMAEASPARRTAMTMEAVAALTSLHSVDWAAHGLDFLLTRAAGDTSITRDINWILDMVHYNQMHDERVERAAANLIADQPQDVEDVLIHGDSKFDNFLFVNDKVVAIIDFENSTVAPREHDLAYNVFTSECMSWGLERPDGFLSEEEMCSAYEKASGHQLRHWDYFMRLNRFKFSSFILSYTARMPGVQEQNPDFYAYFWNHIEKLGG